MVKKLKEIINILNQQRDFLRKEFNVDKIGIFGSYSRNQMTSESDIDILVEFFEVIDLFEYIRLENYLSEILGIKVDLVTLNALRKELKHGIMSDLIYA